MSIPLLAAKHTAELDRLTVEISRSRTIRHTHTPGWIPLNEWAARLRCCYLNKAHKSQDTNI